MKEMNEETRDRIIKEASLKHPNNRDKQACYINKYTIDYLFSVVNHLMEENKTLKNILKDHTGEGEDWKFNNN